MSPSEFVRAITELYSTLLYYITIVSYCIVLYQSMNTTQLKALNTTTQRVRHLPQSGQYKLKSHRNTLLTLESVHAHTHNSRYSILQFYELGIHHKVDNTNSSIIVVLTNTRITHTHIHKSSTHIRYNSRHSILQLNELGIHHKVDNTNSSLVAISTNTRITDRNTLTHSLTHALPTTNYQLPTPPHIPYLAQIARSLRCVGMRALERVELA